MLSPRQFEQEARKKGYTLIAGVDEAGRGPLAGPVTAAACIIPLDIHIPGVDDSKKLSPATRERLYHVLTTHPAISFHIASVSAATIDEIGILPATFQAMTQAIDGLPHPPDLLLVDGRGYRHSTIPTQCIIHGDALSYPIAAASILAKVFRDRHLLELHALYPHYGFDRHKGYGTKAHLQALQQFGPSPIHRKTFAPLSNG